MSNVTKTKKFAREVVQPSKQFAKMINGEWSEEQVVYWLCNGTGKCKDAIVQAAFLMSLQDKLLIEEGREPSALSHEIVMKQLDRIERYGLKSFPLSEKQVVVIVSDFGFRSEERDAAIAEVDALIIAANAKREANA